MKGRRAAEPGTAASGWHKLALLGLVLVAALRLLWMDTLLLEPEHDSWIYTLEARRVGEEGVSAYLGGTVRRAPLFPLLAGLVVKAGLSPLSAAKLIANAFYLGTLLGTYALALLLFGSRVAILATALLALDNVFLNLGVKPFIDIGQACLLTWSLALLIAVTRCPRAGLAVLLGLCLLGATLVRPEGAVFSGILLAATLISAWRRRFLSHPAPWVALGTYLAGFALLAAPVHAAQWGQAGLGGRLLLESTEAYRLSPGSPAAGHWPAVDVVARKHPHGDYPSMAQILVQDPALHLRRLTRNVWLYLRGVSYHLHPFLASLLLAGLIVGLVKKPGLLPPAAGVAACMALFAAPYIFLSAVDERLALASYPQVCILAALGALGVAAALEGEEGAGRRASSVLLILVLLFAGLRNARYLQSSWLVKYTRDGYPPILSAWREVAPEVRRDQGRVVIFGPVWKLYLPAEVEFTELWRQVGLAELNEVVTRDRPRFLLLAGSYHESEEAHDFFRRVPPPGRLGSARLSQVYPRRSEETDVRVFELSYPGGNL